jgi:hypothetical protein
MAVLPVVMRAICRHPYGRSADNGMATLPLGSRNGHASGLAV